MRKFQRAPEPEFLAKNWEAWGTEWEDRRTANPSATFGWRQIDGEPVNHKLLRPLKEQTQHHCSFCDNFPVSPPSLDTIEHFRPKSKFPRDAYRWSNLYFCCMACQQKSDEFDEAALQPDAEDYDFDRYFRWDYTRGTLEVNERGQSHDQQRARVTIGLYRLNDRHPTHRKWQQEIRARSRDLPLDRFPYRNFIE